MAIPAQAGKGPEFDEEAAKMRRLNMEVHLDRVRNFEADNSERDVGQLSISVQRARDLMRGDPFPVKSLCTIRLSTVSI